MLTYDMNKRGEESLYAHLYRCIRTDIEQGAIAPDERLPSKRSFAQHLGVSVITVEGAYAQLLAEGYIYTRERRGYYASALPQRSRSAGRAATRRVAWGEGARRGAENLPGAARETTDIDIDFTDGHLGYAEETAALWGRAVRRTLNEEPASELFADLPGAGHPRLRKAIAGHLRAFRGMEVDPACIVIGAGAQLFYTLLAQMLGAGARMAVEDPGFARIARSYAAAGLDVREVPLDAQGIEMETLDALDAGAVHVMPSHQFPTGIVMSAARRYELLGWAADDPRRVIVEDDYDCEFRLSGRPIPALASIDAFAQVAYLNTFSKSLSSALRVAYLVLPPELSARFENEFGFYACTVSALDQIVLARLIESGEYERHINRVRTRHRAVRDELVGALLASRVASRLRFHGLDAGLHFVLEVEGGDAEEIMSTARGYGVALAALTARRALRRSSSAKGARFAIQYGSFSSERSAEAGRRLAEVLADYFSASAA